MSKALFLDNQLWSSTFGASFQRADVYRNEVAPEEKVEFKKFIRQHITNNICNRTSYSEQDILNGIQSLQKVSRKYKNILSKGELTIGVCQKLINLHLKFRWVTGGLTAPPPHCPFDRIILQQIFSYKTPSWTKENDLNKYKLWVEEAKKVSGSECLADWELNLYNSLTL